MKKIGILTINDYNNYGNRLQNYGTQEILKELGFNVDTIVNKTVYSKLNKKPTKLNRLNNLLKLGPKEIYRKTSFKLNLMINKDQVKQNQKIREDAFRSFTKENITETDYYILDDNIPKNLSDKYDYFVTGSDQVWNPNNHRTSSIDFLTFAEQHKRIAFAPSFGVSEIKPELEENYRVWISEMDRLSVREDDGAKIVKELTGRDAPVLVDPTLLLTKEKWLTVAKEARNKPKQNYLLTYFLGGVPNNYKNQIEGIARENNLEIINLGDIREEETYMTGPSEFIDYINSCSILCTDSFHGVVFSILFEKSFLVYERMGSTLSMFSRIATLLNKFDLNSRKAQNIKTNEEVFNIDYSHLPPILEEERNKAFKYLRNALNLEDSN